MSASVLDMLSQQLGGDAVKQMSAQLGADEGTVNNAITVALPMLLGGLALKLCELTGGRSSVVRISA